VELAEDHAVSIEYVCILKWPQLSSASSQGLVELAEDHAVAKAAALHFASGAMSASLARARARLSHQHQVRPPPQR
jgi:hypothetical protein